MSIRPLQTLERCVTRLVLVVLTLAISLFLCIWIAPAFLHGNTEVAADTPEAFVLDAVHIVDVDSGLVSYNQAILIRDGLISDIFESSTDSYSGLPRVNGYNQYVIPGLIDMHVHVLDRSYAKGALASGVTTVRNMGGYSYQLKWRNELERGQWFGSRLILSSPIINSPRYGDPLSQFLTDDPEVGRQAVHDFIEQGYDFIKVYEGLNADVYSAILDEASKLNTYVAGHPSYDLLATRPNDHGALRTFEHTEEIYDGFLHQEFDENATDDAAAFLSHHNITLIPTLAVNRELTRLSHEKHAYFSQTDQRAVNPFARAIYERSSYARWLNASDELAEYNLEVDAFLHWVTGVMQREGVTIALGSDAGALTGLPGPATIDEALLMYEAGLSPLEVIQAATLNAALALGMGEKLGKVQDGYIADLILLSENPLDNLQTLRSPSMVIQNGIVFDPQDIAQLKSESYQHTNLVMSVIRHINFLIFG